MGEWRVDPDGVLGVLAGIDDLGPEFVSAHDAIDEAAMNGGAALTADGRKTVAAAWDAFMAERRLVPGALMHVVNAAAGAVSEATVAVVAGDDQMAADTAGAERHAQEAWGIAPRSAYYTPGTRAGW